MIKFNELVEHIAKDQQKLDELNWRQIAGGALIANTLWTGIPQVVYGAQPPAIHRHYGLPSKEYSEQDIINTIVGEAGNQGYNGMLGLACAIRNRAKKPYYRRNVLHGVYGLNAPHIKNEPPEIFEIAKKAWEESAFKDVVDGAYIWGNNKDIDKFKQQPWFKNVEIAVKIGDHTFFKDK